MICCQLIEIGACRHAVTIVVCGMPAKSMQTGRERCIYEGTNGLTKGIVDLKPCDGGGFELECNDGFRIEGIRIVLKQRRRIGLLVNTENSRRRWCAEINSVSPIAASDCRDRSSALFTYEGNQRAFDTVAILITYDAIDRDCR